jgi:hypothetical protein
MPLAGSVNSVDLAAKDSSPLSALAIQKPTQAN